MSLFIGNISRNVRTEDLEDEFDKFGPCTVKVKVSHSTESKSPHNLTLIKSQSSKYLTRFLIGIIRLC